MTNDEIIAVVQADSEGKEIECIELNRADDTWGSAGPEWNFAAFDYRVKTEPKKPREWQVHVQERQLHIVHEAPKWCHEDCIKVREVLE